MSDQRLVGGLDEVGWGALAGPIVCAVAVFSESKIETMPRGVKDSKQTTRTTRDMLYVQIMSHATAVGIGYAWPFEIDLFGPYPALQLSYARALEDVQASPDILQVDGSNRVSAWKGKQDVRPKGDSIFPAVSAASIIAKSYRDEMMREYARSKPEYGWDKNKGYGSPDHIRAIKEHGHLSDVGGWYIHRLAYLKNLLRESHHA